MWTIRDLKDYWGYTSRFKDETAQVLVDILNNLGNFEIIDKTLIYPDSQKDIYEELQAKLTKKFITYKNDRFDKVVPRSIWLREHPSEQEVSLQEFRKRYSPHWRTVKWVNDHIGEYDRWIEGFEFYWNIIGNDWRRNLDGNILLGDKVVKLILADKRYGVGKEFLTTMFVKNGETKKIVGSYKS